MNEMIRLENVNKMFGDLHVLKNVNLTVAEGEKLVIIGPSGSGKSTTVRCMNFLEAPTTGKVFIAGQEMTHKNKRQLVRDNMSMVFQQFNLYPHMTVLKNLTLAPMKLHHKSKEEAEALAYHYLDVVGLRDKAHVYPATLSGGQQQRIAIARALCRRGSPGPGRHPEYPGLCALRIPASGVPGPAGHGRAHCPENDRPH